MIISNNVDLAIDHLRKGNIIAYPTEAVYGLGCDPFNESSVLHLLKIKHRSQDKGLILIAANWEQISPLIQPLSSSQKLRIENRSSKPITWVFPATQQAPEWIRGDHNTIAIRITSHLLARELCAGFQRPIVSTSANLSNQPPAKNIAELEQYFPAIDFILEGELGNLAKPTPIIDVLSGKLYRE